MNALFVDPKVEARVLAAARAIEHAAQYGHNAGRAVSEYEAARAAQAEVRRKRGGLLRKSGAIRW